jgi:hypothetical protein
VCAGSDDKSTRDLQNQASVIWPECDASVQNTEQSFRVRFRDQTCSLQDTLRRASQEPMILAFPTTAGYQMIPQRLLRVFSSATVGLVLLAATTTVEAKVVRWDLRNVTFGSDVVPNADGSASGFFLFDADASLGKQLIAWDISVTPFPPLPAYRLSSIFEPDRGHQYDEHFLYFYSKVLYDVDPYGRTAIELDLFPGAPLSDAGGIVPLGGYERSTYIVAGHARDILTGQLAATVPEPSQVLLLASAFAILVAFSARRPAH